MMVSRLGQSEQHLEEAMNGGRVKQVAPTHDVGHTLRRVVDDDRQVVAGGHLFARQDDIAPHRGIGGNQTRLPARPRPGLRPCDRGGTRQSRLHVETQRVLLACIDTPGPLGCRHMLGVARIKRNAVGIARPRCLRLASSYQACNLSTTFETRIDQTYGVEPAERVVVIPPMFGLTANRLLRSDPQPRQVFVNCRFVFRPAACPVNILDAQQQAPIALACHIGIQQCR